MRAGGFVRALSGLLAGGLVVLVLALLAAWFVADGRGAPGPGASTLGWHIAAAVLAVIGQWQADRRPGRDGTVAALLVIGVTSAVLAAQWLF